MSGWLLSPLLLAPLQVAGALQIPKLLQDSILYCCISLGQGPPLEKAAQIPGSRDPNLHIKTQGASLRSGSVRGPPVAVEKNRWTKSP